VKQQKIPFVADDSVAFLFKGEASGVWWMGDFNGWGNDKNFDHQGKRIPGSDIWILKHSFPPDARLDYKIVIDETTWILDPVNPHQQWSGVGGGSPNSELRMPLWKEDELIFPMEAIFHGRIVKDVLIHSKNLGYRITYSVYIPPDYRPSSSHVYPVIYITDGYEYLHERMGNMPTILDNLIHKKMIKPVIAVLVDHREPGNHSNNRRMQELAMSEKYLAFFAEELIPKVEKQYSISTDPEERAILGASMGGLSAAYFSFKRPDLFGLAGIQSPAFWFKPEIFATCDTPENLPVKIFMTSGNIHDTAEGARTMRDILEKNSCTFEYREVNQGHSWGNWRDLLDEILVYFFRAN
jgi:enterochelin esterase family protein